MQTEHSITISELFTIVLNTGFPVYLIAAIFQVALFYLLGINRKHKLIIIVLLVVSTFISSLLLAIVLWFFYHFYKEKFFILFALLNIPLFIAD